MSQLHGVDAGAEDTCSVAPELMDDVRPPGGGFSVMFPIPLICDVDGMDTLTPEMLHQVPQPDYPWKTVGAILTHLAY